MEVNDKKAEFGINIGVIIQALILAGIIGNVKLLIDIKESISMVVTATKVNEVKLKEHDRRILILERYHKQ